MSKQASIYVRTATQGQGEPDRLAEQERRCRAYAVKCGYDLTHVYAEQAGGINCERPQLAALRAAVQAGEVQVIICTSADRLSRDAAHLRTVMVEAEHAGAGVHFAD